MSSFFMLSIDSNTRLSDISQLFFGVKHFSWYLIRILSLLINLEPVKKKEL